MTNQQISNSFQTIIFSVFSSITQNMPAQNRLSHINKEVKQLEKYFENIDFKNINQDDSRELVPFIEKSIKFLEKIKDLDTDNEFTKLIDIIDNFIIFFNTIIEKLEDNIGIDGWECPEYTDKQLLQAITHNRAYQNTITTK